MKFLRWKSAVKPISTAIVTCLGGGIKVSSDVVRKPGEKTTKNREGKSRGISAFVPCIVGRVMVLF